MSPRRLIGVIAVLVAMVTALAIPAGYGLTSYVAEANALAFKTRLNANRVAKYVYAHGALWPFQRARLAELIEIAESVEPDMVRQRIYANPDRLVLEENRVLAWPTFARSAAIVVGGTDVGRVETETSLRPLIVRTATVAAFAAAFAVASFVVLYRLPRKILDRTLARLAAREQDLATQVYRFELALERMSQGLSMFDGEERLLVCNAKYLTIYRLSGDVVKPGIRFSDILSCRARSHTDPREGEQFIQSRRARLREHKPLDDEVPLRDGRTIAVSTRPTVDGGWISLHQDITEILDAKRERRRAEAEKEGLRQQERAAEMANRAKSAFLAMMSHEIRTPMNAVIGLTSALLETDVDEDQRATLDAVHESGESLLRILNDILDYSKLDAGRLEFENLAFSPAVLLDQLVSIIGPQANSKGLTVRIEHDAELPPALVGDAGRLRQVLMNLLSNAVKFTWTGGITVSARCLARDDGRVQVEWTVADTGVGIPPDRIGSLFDEFVQADSSVSRRYGGSGLGLAISKRIIEQMDGSISVSSVPDAGSTFRVVLWLPWADTLGLEEREDGAALAALEARIAALGRPLRILVAEDNPTNQLVTIKMLKDFDIVTEIAANGLEAVAATKKTAFDVILMDTRMPEMDGLAATGAIRRRGGAFAKVPIIALTANAFVQDVKACRDAGMTDFVAKPVRKHVLVEAILHALPAGPMLRRGAGRPAHVTVPAPPAPMAAEAAARAGGREPLPVDIAAFEELTREIGADGVRQILAIFLRETRRRLDEMRGMSCGADRDTIEIEAHTLKGAAGTFGLRELSELARSLEAGVEGISEDGYRRALERLEAAFALARARIPPEYIEAA